MLIRVLLIRLTVAVFGWGSGGGHAAGAFNFPRQKILRGVEEQVSRCAGDDKAPANDAQ